MFATKVLFLCFAFILSPFEANLTLSTEEIAEELEGGLSSDYQSRPNGTAILSPTLIQILNNSSNNASIMANELEEQALLTNTTLLDVQNDNNTHRLQVRYRERKRQERLFLIQAQILHRLGISSISMNATNLSPLFTDQERSLLARIFQKLRWSRVHGVNQISTSDVFVERMQSFYPSCALPNNTDATLWEQISATSMNIYYQLAFPRASFSDREVTVLNSKLRLYKFEDPEVCPGCPGQNMPVNNQILDNIYRYAAQQGLTISLYQFTRPLKIGRRIKRRLADSRTVAADYRGWVEFNVGLVINHWQSHPHRNHGFQVEMEDAYGNQLNPSSFFTAMNCSVVESPLPNLMMDIHPDIMDLNDTSIFENETYPTLDLLTVEMTREEPLAVLNTSGIAPQPESESRQLTKRHVEMDAEESHRSHSPHRDSTRTGCSLKRLKVPTFVLVPDKKVIWPKSFQFNVCHKSRQWKNEYRYSCSSNKHKDLRVVYLENQEDGQPKVHIFENLIALNCVYSYV